MKEQRKLKIDRSYLWGLIMVVFGVICLICTIIEGETYGTNYTSIVYGAIIIVFCTTLFFRFRYAFVKDS